MPRDFKDRFYLEFFKRYFLLQLIAFGAKSASLSNLGLTDPANDKY